MCQIPRRLLCIHAGGRAVFDAVEDNWNLRMEDTTASRMTLSRFCNSRHTLQEDLRFMCIHNSVCTRKCLDPITQRINPSPLDSILHHFHRIQERSTKRACQNERYMTIDKLSQISNSVFFANPCIFCCVRRRKRPLHITKLFSPYHNFQTKNLKFVHYLHNPCEISVQGG